MELFTSSANNYAHSILIVAVFLIELMLRYAVMRVWG